MRLGVTVYLSLEPLPAEELIRLDFAARDLSADPRLVGVRCVSASLVEADDIIVLREDGRWKGRRRNPQPGAE